MNKYLQQLVNLSQIDQKIDNYAPQIESINRNLQLKKDEIAAIDENIEKTVEKYEFFLKTAFIILISESSAVNHGLCKLLKQTPLYGTMYAASEFLRRKTG